MKRSSGRGFLRSLFFIKTMNKKNVNKILFINKIKWDKKALKNFEGFLKQMYGEYGKIKTRN